MSIGIRELQDAVVSEAQRLGVFDSFSQHEPKSAPEQGLTWACWVQQVDPIRGRSGLASTSARIVFTIRLYSSMTQDPEDEIDPRMVDAADQLTAAYVSNFTLDIAEVEVDVRGAYEIPLSWQAGYSSVGQGMYRILDITLPLVINDVWTEAP